MMALSNLLLAILDDFGPSIRTVFFSIAFSISLAPTRAENFNVEQQHQQDLYTFEALKSRILSGPGALSTQDKVIYFIVIALGFEAFNYIAINLGGKLSFREENKGEDTRRNESISPLSMSTSMDSC
jgi:hypothetical protein